MKIIRELTLFSFIRLAFLVIRTKLFSRSSRIIRFPIYCRGKRYINWGSKLTTGVGCRIEAMRLSNSKPPELKFGSNVQLNDYVHICALEKIIIGNDTLVASHVFISDNSHGSYKGDENDSDPRISPIEREYVTKPVIIGDKVWIGEGVMVMPGVHIGNGVIIGAHSIVRHDIPENTIAVGNPAKIIKRYDEVTQQWVKI